MTTTDSFEFSVSESPTGMDAQGIIAVLVGLLKDADLGGFPDPFINATLNAISAEGDEWAELAAEGFDELDSTVGVNQVGNDLVIPTASNAWLATAVRAISELEGAEALAPGDAQNIIGILIGLMSDGQGALSFSNLSDGLSNTFTEVSGLNAEFAARLPDDFFGFIAGFEDKMGSEEIYVFGADIDDAASPVIADAMRIEFMTSESGDLSAFKISTIDDTGGAESVQFILGSGSGADWFTATDDLWL